MQPGPSRHGQFHNPNVLGLLFLSTCSWILSNFPFRRIVNRVWDKCIYKVCFSRYKLIHRKYTTKIRHVKNFKNASIIANDAVYITLIMGYSIWTINCLPNPSGKPSISTSFTKPRLRAIVLIECAGCYRSLWAFKNLRTADRNSASRRV